MVPEWAGVVPPRGWRRSLIDANLLTALHASSTARGRDAGGGDGGGVGVATLNECCKS